MDTAPKFKRRCASRPESAVSKDLIELPSTGSKRQTSATVQPYHICGCRDNPPQPMAPRRRGSRVPSLRSVFMQPTLTREYLFVLGSWGAFSAGCQPGVRVVPFWSVSGSPPLTRSAIVRWQEATDPQSTEGGSQRACHTEVAHSTASGRFSTVALFKQSYPALAVRKLSLWVASPGDMSEPPFSDRSLGRRPSVTLFQRGTACFRLVKDRFLGRRPLLSHSVGVFIDSGRW